jgi:hypothetical protein
MLVSPLSGIGKFGTKGVVRVMGKLDIMCHS